MRRLPLLPGLLCLALGAGAAEMRSISVERVDGRYVLQSEVWFGADIEDVYTVFLDYDLSTQFSSAVADARNVAPDDEGRPRYYVKNQGCVLFFCIEVERNGYLEHDRPAVIRAFADPEQSDFELCNESWRFRRDGDGTAVIYDLEMRPKFWVPPVIGPYLIKRKLRKGGGEAIDRIEAIANDGKRWQ